MYKQGQGQHNFHVFVLGYVVVLIAAVAAGIAVNFNLGLQVGLSAILAWILFTGVWIVFMDSRSRWPDVGAFTRFVRVMTFYKG
jgi:hypothetical protein